MEEDAYEVYDEIIRLNLHRIKGFDEISKMEFARIYNGCGPDSWPEEMRDIMTWIYRYFKPVMGVHDVEFDQGDGTTASWLITQDHWKKNLSIVLADRFPIWKVWRLARRAFEWAKARFAYRALGVFAYNVYVESSKKNIK